MTGAPLHHPSAETLVGYAAGTLRAGFDFVVAAHVQGCRACQNDIAALESVGGEALRAVQATDLSSRALDHALSRLDQPAPPSAPPRTISDVLAAAKRRWVAPGVWVAKVATPHDPNDRVYMLGAAPGAATARHSHQGVEFTQILSGQLSDDDAVFNAGDFAENDDAHVHQPRSTGDAACVCLFATNGRLRPAGWIGRIAFAIADV